MMSKHFTEKMCVGPPAKGEETEAEEAGGTSLNFLLGPWKNYSYILTL